MKPDPLIDQLKISLHWANSFRPISAAAHCMVNCYCRLLEEAQEEPSGWLLSCRLSVTNHKKGWNEQRSMKLFIGALCSTVLLPVFIITCHVCLCAQVWTSTRTCIVLERRRVWKAANFRRPWKATLGTSLSSRWAQLDPSNMDVCFVSGL